MLISCYIRLALVKLCECSHTTVIKDMCADCGADLRHEEEVYFIWKANF